jgi:hypothetical protein
MGVNLDLLPHPEGWTFTESDNRVLKRVYGCKKEEVTGEYEKLHMWSFLIYILHSSDIIRVMKLRRIR